MSFLNRTMLGRVGFLAAIVLLLVGYIWWQTSGVYQYEEVIPGILYRASIRSREDYVKAINKCDPRAMYFIGNRDEHNTELLDTAVRYSAKLKIRVYALGIEPGDEPSEEQIDRLIATAKRPDRRPVLVLGMDSERSGMLAAAVKLKQEKLPLEQVLSEAELSDASQESADAIREFARKYAQQLKTAPATTQTTAPADE